MACGSARSVTLRITITGTPKRAHTCATAAPSISTTLAFNSPRSSSRRTELDMNESPVTMTPSLILATRPGSASGRRAGFRVTAARRAAASNSAPAGKKTGSSWPDAGSRVGRRTKALAVTVPKSWCPTAVPTTTSPGFRSGSTAPAVPEKITAAGKKWSSSRVVASAAFTFPTPTRAVMMRAPSIVPDVNTTSRIRSTVGDWRRASTGAISRVIPMTATSRPDRGCVPGAAQVTATSPNVMTRRLSTLRPGGSTPQRSTISVWFSDTLLPVLCENSARGQIARQSAYSIDGEVLVRHQSFGAFHDAQEEVPRDLVIEHPIAILRDVGRWDQAHAGADRDLEGMT